MIDITKYYSNIQHDACENNQIESSSTNAVQLDGISGLAKDLGFHSSGLNKVDYIKLHENNVFFVELTNLKEDIQECIACDELLKRSSEVRRCIKEVDKNGLRAVQKKLWMEILEEFKGKWMGSIALYERLLRRNGIADDPIYRLVVVLKNDTDTRERDLLQITLNNKLSGMMSKIEVRLTSEL